MKGWVIIRCLHRLLRNRLDKFAGASDGCALTVGGDTAGIAVDLEEAGHVELRLLEDLDLPDVDVVHWVNLLARVLDLLGNGVRDELHDQLLEGAVACLPIDDIHHLCPNRPFLCALRVRCLADLEFGLLRETNDEDPENVAIGGLDVSETFDQRLPLLDQALELVSCEVHPVEVGEQVLAINVLHFQLDLAVERLIVLEVVEAHLVDPALEAISGELQALGP
mmetsp:Transcript_3708/g.3806  ORF Transcript_3708/g.3806 Transcript_3708/m.3806 type:complete len:223 (-) Transcript_3708:129-797(-)